jgi:muramidase (phage lysozyme)
VARSKEELLQLVNNPNVVKFRDFIAKNEVGVDYPNNGYNTLYTGRQFEGAQHPKIAIKGSTAAGRYQILGSTWDDINRNLSLSDFSPANQDLAATYLLDRYHALDDVIDGNFDTAIPKVDKVWVALQKYNKYVDPNTTNNQIDIRSLFDTQNSFALDKLAEDQLALGDFLSFEDGLLNVIDTDGQRGTAVAQSPKELSLFDKFRMYDEETRGKLLAIAPILVEAKQQAKNPTPSFFPREYDSQILELLDSIEVK